jgi:hypothetical protein
MRKYSDWHKNMRGKKRLNNGTKLRIRLISGWQKQTEFKSKLLYPELLYVPLYRGYRNKIYKSGAYVYTGYHDGTFKVGDYIILEGQKVKVLSIRHQLAYVPLEESDKGWKHWVKADQHIRGKFIEMVMHEQKLF